MRIVIVSEVHAISGGIKLQYHNLALISCTFCRLVIVYTRRNQLAVLFNVYISCLSNDISCNSVVVNSTV